MDWSNLGLLDYPYIILRNSMFKVSIKYDTAGLRKLFECVCVCVLHMFSPPQ